MRLAYRCLLLGAFAAMLATPAAAGEPQKPFIFDLSDPDLDEDEGESWTAECGFPVTADISGHIIFHHAKNGAVEFITVYHQAEILTSAPIGRSAAGRAPAAAGVSGAPRPATDSAMRHPPAPRLAV